MLIESNGNLFQVVRTLKKASLKEINKELLQEYMEYKGGNHMLENPEVFFIVKKVIDVEFEEIKSDNNEQGIPVLERGMESEQSNNE